jgi:uncharacterized protein YrrD
MRVELGTDVYSSDDEKVGSVDRVVLDPRSREIHSFVVHRGFLTPSDKLVPIDMVRGQDGDGLRLDLPEREFSELPDFVEERYVQVPEQDWDALPFIVPNAMGAGGYLYGAPYAGRGYEGSHDSFFDAAPAVAPIVETRSNILETDVMISEGTDVVGSDGEKIGTVGNVVVGDGGAIRGFVVSAGLVLKRDVRIPIDWVSSAGEDEVRLRVTAAEAEARDFDIEDSTL